MQASFCYLWITYILGRLAISSQPSMASNARFALLLARTTDFTALATWLPDRKSLLTAALVKPTRAIIGISQRNRSFVHLPRESRLHIPRRTERAAQRVKHFYTSGKRVKKFGNSLHVVSNALAVPQTHAHNPDAPRNAIVNPQ